MNLLRPMRLNSVFVCLCGLMAVASARAQNPAAIRRPAAAQQPPAPAAPQQNSNNPFENVPQAEPAEAAAQPPPQPQFEAPKAAEPGQHCRRSART